MYHVMMERYTPTQIHRDKVSVWNGGRIKEARGQLKHQLNDTFSMLRGHEFFGAHTFYVNFEEKWVRLYNSNHEETLFIGYTIEERE